MYAIVQTGGRQVRVEQGATVYVEYLDAPVGEKVTLREVLAIGDEKDLQVGRPRLESASVEGTVLEQGRDAKVRVFKYKKRKHYRRTRGHRQSFTALRIDAIRA